MNTPIGVAYATQQVADLIARGRQHHQHTQALNLARIQAAQADIEAEATRKAAGWMDKALPCLPAEEPHYCDGTVVFAYPGLTLRLVPSAIQGWAAPTLEVGDFCACEQWLARGEPITWRLPESWETPEQIDARRLDLAAAIADRQDQPLATCSRCHPQPPKVRQAREITPAEMRFLDAVREFIVANTPEAF